MSLGIKAFATGGVGTKNFLDNSRWKSGFTMDSWIHDGCLDSRWILGFTMDFWIHDIFLDQASWLIVVFLILANVSKGSDRVNARGL